MHVAMIGSGGTEMSKRNPACSAAERGEHPGDERGGEHLMADELDLIADLNAEDDDGFPEGQDDDQREVATAHGCRSRTLFPTGTASCVTPATPSMALGTSTPCQ